MLIISVEVESLLFPTNGKSVSASVPFLIQRPFRNGTVIFIHKQNEFFLLYFPFLSFSGFFALFLFFLPPSLFLCLMTLDPQLFIAGSMRPITIVKRFLQGEPPSIPLPPGIDDDVASHSSTAPWLWISQSPTKQQPTENTSEREAECQTISALQPFYNRLNMHQTLASCSGRHTSTSTFFCTKIQGA